MNVYIIEQRTINRADGNPQTQWEYYFGTKHLADAHKWVRAMENTEQQYNVESPDRKTELEFRIHEVKIIQ